MGARVFWRVTTACLAATLCGFVAAADKLSDLQARFDAENNGVRKAKMLQHLGDAEFDEAARAQRAGDFSAVGLLMEKYRDNVAAASAALEKENPDGEHHPGGYKQLEMHVQKGLRELDEYLLLAPDPFKPPLQLVREDLINVDNKLLRILFPTHRQGKPADAVSPTGPSDVAWLTVGPTDPGVSL
jgi:hypothetical protein